MSTSIYEDAPHLQAADDAACLRVTTPAHGDVTAGVIREANEGPTGPFHPAAGVRLLFPIRWKLFTWWDTMKTEEARTILQANIEMTVVKVPHSGTSQGEWCMQPD